MSIELLDITPQDLYVVKIKEPISQNQISYLVDLYQPIIGVEATNVYLSLLNHLPFGQLGVSELKMHRQLMIKMYLSFKNIIKARKVLEAIGLIISTKYKHRDKEEYVYEYELLAPLYPFQFFQSDILSLLLINRIGKNQFQLLKRNYLPEMNWANDKYIKEEEITKSFDEIFDTIMASELKIEPDSELDHLLQPFESDNKKDEPLQIKNKYLNIDFIKGMVSDLYKKNNIFTPQMLELLNQLAFLYKLTDTDVISLLKDHTIYDKSGRIDEVLLTARVKEKYHYQQKEVIIINKDNLKNKPKKEDINIENKAEKHRWVLENFSPIELMEQYQGGGKIPDADLAIIEGLLQDYKLPFEVVNVLIEYIMLTNEYKLPKKLTEKIAGHWKRLKIKTVEEALEVAKKEHQLYKGWKDIQQGQNQTKTTERKANSYKPNTVKKEKIPDYILQQDEKYHKKTNKDLETEPKIDLKDKIDQLLKDLGEA